MAIETMVPPGLEALSGAVADVAARLRDSVVGVITPGHGGGAGVIWQEDGLIVTNAHVVRGDGAEVVFADGRRLTARLVAREPGVDLAALRVEASGLPAAPLGDSDALRVGQLVLAMGHPLGESHAVALGIISSVGRPLQGGGERLPNAVQADLALYPGNS